MRTILGYFLIAGIYVVGGLTTIIGWFRRKRPAVPEDAEWVSKATERELTVARLTGKYPPHPPGRKPVYYRPSDKQIRELAQKIIEEGKRNQAKRG